MVTPILTVCALIALVILAYRRVKRENLGNPPEPFLTALRESANNGV